LEVYLPPVDGENGWYVSDVELSASGSDAISGLSALTASADEGDTWINLPIQFTDGDHQVLVRARDVAGNETSVSKEILVDTVPPISQIVSLSDGAVVQGDVQISGTLMDETSGPIGGEISMDGGVSWQNVAMDGNAWSALWNSGEVPNGGYAIQLRGMDRAGNEGELVSITLTVDNGPPAVSITEQWWIWESGHLKVSPNHFLIASVEVTIRDPQNRWPAVEMDLNPKKDSFPIIWDRHFGDGTLAPSGEYSVLAVACDVNGLCGQDDGRIMIPSVSSEAVPTATQTPLPTMTSTPVSSKTPMATKILPTPTLAQVTPIPDGVPEPVRSPLPFWPIIGLLGLFLVISSASVVDPRPKALDRLKETFRMISAQSTYFEHKKEK
jgi:hypothetical protein